MAAIEETILRNSRPSDTKEKGLAILGSLVMSRGMLIVNRMVPKLEQLITPFTDSCPNQELVKTTIQVRNNIVSQANFIGNFLTKVSSSLQIASTFLGVVISVIGILRGAKVGTSLASKFLPVTPGAVPSLLSDLDDVITNTTFDSSGNSKIEPIKQQLDGITVPVALITFYINKLISTLNTLDTFILDCTQGEVGEAYSLTPISKELDSVAQTQTQADDSPNLSTYQGFVIEIEEVPFSANVNRKRAVGKNSEGITLIQTELSFATRDQILINELKFTIDKDNLRAY
jgi:hypothetical protein